MCGKVPVLHLARCASQCMSVAAVVVFCRRHHHHHHHHHHHDQLPHHQRRMFPNIHRRETGTLISVLLEVRILVTSLQPHVICRVFMVKKK